MLTIGKHSDSIIKLLEEKYQLENIFNIINNLMIKIGSGKISFEEFCKFINNKFNINLSTEEMKNIFAEAIHPNNQIIEIMNQLKNQLRLILLSNNDFPTIEILKDKHKEMLNLFEKLYFSVELKIRKPNKELFEFAIKDANLTPEECLFIDDKEKNIVASKKLGIKSILFTDIEQLKKELTFYYINVN